MSIENEDASSAEQTKAVAVPEMDLVSIHFDFHNLNIHIENSCKIRSRKAIKEMLSFIMTFDDFKKLQEAGFSRSYESMVIEWFAHNYLHDRGYKPDHTASVDIDQNESTLRRIAYWFLALLYKGDDVSEIDKNV